MSAVTPVKSFRSRAAFRAWLAKNHAASDGIWLRLYRKNTGPASVTYKEALEEALCYGWIDSQVRRYDDISRVQRFTPRRARSPWSKLNVARAERLMRARRMRAPGRREIERAKADGRWDAAYDPPSRIALPADFARALAASKKAAAFFRTLGRQNTYAIYVHLTTAKTPETRARRIATFIAQLGRGEPIVPRRRNAT